MDDLSDMGTLGFPSREHELLPPDHMMLHPSGVVLDDHPPYLRGALSPLPAAYVKSEPDALPIEEMMHADPSYVVTPDSTPLDLSITRLGGDAMDWNEAEAAAKVNSFFVPDPVTPSPPALELAADPIPAAVAVVDPLSLDPLASKLQPQFAAGLVKPEPVSPPLLADGLDRRTPASVLEQAKLTASVITPLQRAAAERKEKERAAKGRCNKPLAMSPPDFIKKRKEPGMEEDRREVKRQQRLMRNRVSAQLSRERKKAYVGQLEARLTRLDETNRQLVDRMNEILAENSTLRARLAALDPSSENSSISSPPHSPTRIHYSPMSPFEHVSSDDEVRPAKKSKASNSSSGAGGNKRFGLVAFALVFSFGVFYHMVGLDMQSNTYAPEVPSSPTMRGRVLHSLENAPALDITIDNEKEASVTSTGSQSTVTAMDIVRVPTPTISGLNGESMEESKQTEKKSIKVLNQIQMLALSKKLQQKLPGYEKSSDDVALTRISINTDQDDVADTAAAVDLYKRNQNAVHDHLMQAMDMYKKMLLQTNGTDLTKLPQSIMFCPSAVHFYPRVLAKTAGIVASNNNTLDVSIDGALPPLERVNAEAPGFDPSRMLIWVPSSAISAEFAEQFVDNHTVTRESQAAPAGVSEMTVQVMNFRPVTTDLKA